MSISPRATEEIETIANEYRRSLASQNPPTANAEIAKIAARHRHLGSELTERLKAERLRWLIRRSMSAPRAHVPDAIRPEAATQRIHDYELLDWIGAGGFGEVWRARDVVAGGEVAIKRLHYESCAAADVVVRFRNEAEIAARIKHEGVVRVRKAGFADDRHYLVMDFVDGSDLRKLAELERLDWRDAVRLMSGVATILAEIHARGVLHRDLKPENVLVEKSGNVRITDFGLAKALGQSSPASRLSHRIGTPDFMAPEQADDFFGEVGRWSDIYALGATLYFLLTNRVPFERPRVESKAEFRAFFRRRGLCGPYRARRDVPRSLWRVCRKCLETFPEDRYASAADVAADLALIADGKAVFPEWVSPFKRWENFRRFNPAMAVTIAAAAVIASVLSAAAIGFGIYKNSEARIARVAAASASRDEAAVAYNNDMRAVQSHWERGERDRIADILDDYESPSGDDPRGFEWHYWRSVLGAPTPRRIEPRREPWNRPAFDPTGRRLALIDRHGHVSVFDSGSDSPSKDPLYEIATPTRDIVYDASGRYCVTLRADRRGGVELHDAGNGRLLRGFAAGDEVTAVAIHSPEPILFAGDANGHVRVWHLESAGPSPERPAVLRPKLPFDRLGLIDGPDGPGDVPSPVSALSYEPIRHYLFVGFENGRVEQWRLGHPYFARDEDAASWVHDAEVVMAGLRHTGPVTGFSPTPMWPLQASQSSGKTLVNQRDSAVGEVKIWSLNFPSLWRTFIPHTLPVEAPGSPFSDRAIEIPTGRPQPIFGEGRVLYTTGDRGPRLWDVDTGTATDLPGTGRPVVGIAYAPSRGLLAAVDTAGVTEVHLVPDRVEHAIVCRATGGRSLYGLSVSPDGERIAVATNSHGEVSPSLAERHIRPERLDGFFPGDDRRGLAVYRISSGALELVTSEQKVRLEPRFVASQDEIASVDFAGSRLTHRLAGDGRDEDSSVPLPETGTDRIWNESGAISLTIKTGEREAELRRSAEPDATLRGHLKEVLTAAMSPDGDRVATGSRDRTAILWSAVSATKSHVLRHPEAVTALAFDAEGGRLATGDDAGSVRVWDAETGELVWHLSEHRREVTAVAFLPDGRRLVSSSGLASPDRNEPGEVLLWDLGVGRRSLRLATPRSAVYSGVAVSPDGRRIYASVNPIVPAGRGAIVMWDASRRGR